MEYIKDYAWCFYMGASFGMAGWSFKSWKFYCAIVPIIILELWSTI